MSMSSDQLPMTSGFPIISQTASAVPQFHPYRPSQFRVSDQLSPLSSAEGQWQSGCVANQISPSHTEEYRGFSRSFSGPLTPASWQQNIPSHSQKNRNHNPSSGQLTRVPSSRAPWPSRTPFNQQQPPQQETGGFSESRSAQLGPSPVSRSSNIPLSLNPILAHMITDVSIPPQSATCAAPPQFYESATIPPVTRLTIVLSDRPWEIQVRPSGAHVTILDILEKIYNYLRKGIGSKEYWQNNHRDEICLTWYRKLEGIKSDSERAEVKLKGVLRIDSLCGKTNVNFLESVDVGANGPILHMEFSAS